VLVVMFKIAFSVMRQMYALIVWKCIVITKEVALLVLYKIACIVILQTIVLNVLLLI